MRLNRDEPDVERLIELKQVRIRLALHCLQPAAAESGAQSMPGLLLVHALGGSARDWDVSTLHWPGSVHALDLAGHGQSGRLYGGGYCAELWATDVDVALGHLGSPSVVVGAGAGTYVGLLAAAIQPERVAAVVLLDGAGLHAAGPMPDFAKLPFAPATSARDPGVRSVPAVDPAVFASELALRPIDLAVACARTARRVLLIEAGHAQPPWWEALRELEQVDRHPGPLADALQHLRASVP
jgi:pimeloyl-ACP methyl ester carboxylesterase